MKIWLLLSRFEMGGLERVQAMLASSLLGAGHDVWLVAGYFAESGRALLPPGVPTLSVAENGVMHFPWGLYSALARHAPDLVFTTSTDVACLTLVMRRLFFPRLKVVCTEHLSFRARQRGGTLARLKRGVVQLLMRRLYPSADACVAVSAGVRDEVDRLVQRPCCRLIYNPVRLSGTLPAAARAPLPWPDRDIPSVVWVGRMEPVKRLDMLIDVCEALWRTRRLRLVLVGGGSQGAALRRRLAGNPDVFFAGVVADPSVYIRASDVLVLCSDAEGFGNVLVEAMACGVQIVATDCPHGPREILQDGLYGQLVPCADSHALCEAITGVVEGTHHVAPASLRARAEDFAPGHAAQAYLALVQQLSGQ